ncbi:MAG: hypothetical protein WD800_00255 [Dehalococcoidia bacterium]
MSLSPHPEQRASTAPTDREPVCGQHVGDRRVRVARTSQRGITRRLLALARRAFPAPAR